MIRSVEGGHRPNALRTPHGFETMLGGSIPGRSGRGVTHRIARSASFGALVFIFQEGRLERLLRFRSPGSIELTIPIVMFAVVFGLAMDYELFLLSRIREAYDETGDTHGSVTPSDSSERGS